MSDHNPRAYIVTNDETENIWDYTDASILVTFMPVHEENLTNKKLQKKIKILQAKNIWHFEKFVV